MSKIKSLDVNNGDMYYIQHNSGNFTIIDCNLSEENEKNILEEIKNKYNGYSEILRFVSTHPDKDHIGGLNTLDKKFDFRNFYCVDNCINKEPEDVDYKKYYELRDSDKCCNIKVGLIRHWLNRENSERGSSGLFILWPDVGNPYFKEELSKAEDSGEPNNISPIIKYKATDGVTVLWMGDLESDFLEKIENEINWPTKVDILFAPHHGRDSGKVPISILNKLNPKVIFIGKAKSEDLNYYGNYHTITQNYAKNVLFDCSTNRVDIYSSNPNYDVDFLEKGSNLPSINDETGTLYYMGYFKL